jgi:transposase
MASEGCRMSDLFWLTDAQMERLKPFSPLSRGVSRVDDKRVLSGIIFISRNRLRWRDAPSAYGPPKTLYSRWVRGSRLGVCARMRSLPKAGALLADRGYDANGFRNALTDMGIQPCIPSRKNRKVPIEHDADLDKTRHRIENTFGRIKDRRRVDTRYDRCADLFLSACALAAVVMFRIGVLSRG